MIMRTSRLRLSNSGTSSDSKGFAFENFTELSPTNEIGFNYAA